MSVKRVRFTFPEALIQEPVIYLMGHEFRVITNVRMADVDEKTGWVILELEGDADEIDRSLVLLLARRGNLVTQAASFKKTTDDVRAPARVEQVIAKVRHLATELGASPDVTEQVYRAMIAAFIQQELAEHARLGTPTN